MTRLKSHIGPLIRFALVGVLNTGVYYAFYLVLVLALPYLVAHVLAWSVAITFSFLMNCRFTYKVRPTWRRYAMFPLSNLPNIIATSVGVVALVELLHMNTKLAPLVAGVCAIPFSYLLGRVLMTWRHADVRPSTRTLETTR